MRIGFICSSGGSALLAAAAICPEVEFRVITDRACGAEAGCASRGIDCHRVEWSDREAFSTAANGIVNAEGGCDLVVMFYSRLVSAPLVGGQRLLNIHPSLLPAFKGIGAVAQAYRAGARFLGATLHTADEQMDNGPTIAQASCPTHAEWSLEDWQHISFLQKTALLLLAIQLSLQGQLRWDGPHATLVPGWCIGDRLNPMLTAPRYLTGVRQLQKPGLKFL